jgi:hypothetical protein
VTPGLGGIPGTLEHAITTFVTAALLTVPVPFAT